MSAVPVRPGYGVFFTGDATTVDPLIADLAAGTEYQWFKTDGAGLLLDIITGIA